MRPGRFGRYAIRTADGVQEAAYLPIGGIEQYIRVRGRSRAHPVLLVLHGGPGSTLGATACRWQGALEAAFTVVHWDQRGSGNTYYRDPAAPPPTVERLLSDLDELVDALRARYGQDRLFLLGHSWGSLLGGLYALRRPEKLSAWLPVSQMVDFKRSEQVSAAEAIRRARGAGGGRGTAGAGAGAGAGPAAAGPGGGRSPAAVSPAEGAVSAAPVRRAVSAGGTGRPGADRKRPAVEAPL